MHSDMGGGGEDSPILVRLHELGRAHADFPVTFQRRELDQLLGLYGRMVAAAEWRDYAIDHLPDRAIFSVYRRTSEVPLFQIIKCPKLARRQGAYMITGAGGQILKRGQELPQLLRFFDKKLLLVKA